MRVLVEGLHRGEIISYLGHDPFIRVVVEEWKDDQVEKNAELEALMRTLISQFEQYVRISKKISGNCGFRHCDRGTWPAG